MKKTIGIRSALPGFLILAAAMTVCCAILKISPHIPLAFGCVLVSVTALRHGYTVRELVRYMLSGIRQSLGALIILLLIGALTAVWRASGTVPAMMYYSVRFIGDRLFLPGVFLLCGVSAMALGSWGTAGTVGVAMMGVGSALGIPAALTAGAVVSAAYLGDKASPLTDCLNLTASTADCDIRVLVKKLLPVLWKTVALVTLLYFLAGLRFQPEPGAGEAVRQTLLRTLFERFRPSLLLLLPFVSMVCCAVFGLGAIPAILVGIGTAFMLAVFRQPFSVPTVLRFMVTGFRIDGALESVLSGGGIAAMLYTASLALLALAFGGVAANTHYADALIDPLLQRIGSPAAMITLTVGTAICVNAVLPDQYLSIALCGRLYAQAYPTKNVRPDQFANAVSAGAITSPLIPWNSCGLYMTSVLNVGTGAYLPFAFFNLLMPAAFILHSLRRGRKNGGPD